MAGGSADGCPVAASSPTWSREAPVALVVRHAQLFQAAIRAYEDGRAEAAERFWLQTGTLWSEA